LKNYWILDIKKITEIWILKKLPKFGY
jgi:hypothetical protein